VGGSAPLVKGHRRGRVPRSVRSAQLLELADQLFAERGFRGASMDELARRAGVSKPVIYDHFGSKEQLFATCVRRTGEALAEEVEAEVRRESEPRARLRAGSVAYFRFLQGQLQAWAALFAEEEARDARFAVEASRIRLRQSDLMLNLMTETIGTTPSREGRDRLEAMTLALAGAYESLSLWWRQHPDVPPEQLADWLLDLLWPGLERLITQLASANADQAEVSSAAGGSAGAAAPGGRD
jgi:AcrR family transcriptional regulator